MPRPSPPTGFPTSPASPSSSSLQRPPTTLSYDHCTAKYLAQAGVKSDFITLPSKGVHGNGHMMMIEKNNHQVADLLIEWLGSQKS